jgi:nucleotide-binding universal stress UspA family protein
MSPIVCATRGGEASRRTQERAIALAQERGEELIFLCVFDPSFAGPLNSALATALADEQRWLGTALLGIAQARARKSGLEAQAAVRSGPVLASIEEYLRQVDADTLVIGASKTAASLSSFGMDEVRGFADRVREDTGAEVIVVTPAE